ncbi:MAG: hypothetical protein K5639_08160 [Eubacterium sp.]|nr:hypothetical protein [Eubacterium sp.]
MENEKKGLNVKTIIIIAAIAFAVIVAVAGIIIWLQFKKSKNYENANIYLQTKRYEEAYELFDDLGSYKDSETKATEAKQAWDYEEAGKAMGRGDYEKAITLYDGLKGYKDSSSKLTECKNALVFKEAEDLYEKKDYDGAIAKLETLTDYKEEEKEEILSKCHREKLVAEINAKIEEKDFYGARDILDSDNGQYIRGQQQVQLYKTVRQPIAYDEGVKAKKKKLFYTAYKNFEEAGDYKDAKSKKKSCVKKKPKTKVTYRKKGASKAVSLKIKAPKVKGQCVYMKIYKYKNKEKLIGCVFLHPGKTATIRLPRGTYHLKAAYSSGKWFGKKEMFGDNARYQKLMNGGSDKFKLKGSGYILTLGGVVNGNVGTRGQSRSGF